jgi:hypothetical protein
MCIAAEPWQAIAVGQRGPSGGFSWWVPHDRATRRAQALFLLVAGVLAAYVAAVVVIVLVCIRLAEVGPWRFVANGSDRLGPLGIAALIVGLYALAGVAIASVGWGGFKSTTRRFVGARVPDSASANDAQGFVATFSLARGILRPEVCVIDDPAPNACVFGTANNGTVCLTAGALSLPARELEALCSYLVTSLTSREYVCAVSAADLLRASGLATNALWATAWAVLLSAAIGVPGPVVAAAVLGIALLVVVTKPLLALTDRALPHLFDEVDALCDLETVRCTAQPSALAALLVHLLEDRRRVATRSQVAHLWFERDDIDGAGLVMRAETAIELADGDPILTARLRRVAHLT